MAKGAAGGDVDEEEGETGAGNGVPAIFGRRRGLAGKEDGTPVPGEVVATSAGAPGTRQRRPEAKSWRQHHGCRRGGTPGGHLAKRRASRGGGGGGDAGGGDGAAGRRTVEAAPAAGGGRRQGRERRTAGRGAAAVGELGKGLKRENARRGLHFIGWGREPGTGEGGTATGMAAGGNVGERGRRWGGG
uniref:BKRF1 encodes EBNA-1 protein-like n=1 Tax=Oryza sativa subsp. japonica TaxID=39947 RepID=Q2QPN3_ORYSJ|nr:hypothetical protein LOC_Os12g33879 [Oryza sativa Japonica Group]ABA99216.1 hypothetical protein LOC_Os12g33859 [Oryza sativa Japonica Group]